VRASTGSRTSFWEWRQKCRSIVIRRAELQFRSLTGR
jgi:hypothetical protein